MLPVGEKISLYNFFGRIGGHKMIEFKGFTETANAALNKAADTAINMGHTYIGSEHILYGLLCEERGAAYTALSKCVRFIMIPTFTC